MNVVPDKCQTCSNIELSCEGEPLCSIYHLSPFQVAQKITRIDKNHIHIEQCKIYHEALEDELVYSSGGLWIRRINLKTVNQRL